MNDLRSLPDSVLRVYLYSLGAWGVGLLFLFAAQRTIYGISLCYPLSLWLGLVTGWWGVTTFHRAKEGELSRDEVRAGVRSVGQILAGGALTPAIVFLAVDPFSPSSWGTCVSIGILSGLCWVAMIRLVMLEKSWSNAVALLVAWIALPINATGALSLGFWLGLFDKVIEPLT